jgi:hypothetical protein
VGHVNKKKKSWLVFNLIFRPDFLPTFQHAFSLLLSYLLRINQFQGHPCQKLGVMRITCCCSFQLKGPSVFSVPGVSGVGQVSLLSTVVLPARAVLFTIATIATEIIKSI